MTEKEVRIINGKEIVLYRHKGLGSYLFAEDAVEMLLEAFEEFEQYRAIGTIEEFKALKEKSEQKKPNNIPMDDACIYYENHCPNCDSLLVVRYKCCPKCGQKLDWSE